LAQFARLDISLEELCGRLGEMLTIEFTPRERRLTSHFLVTKPGIRVVKEHIQHALERRKDRSITTPQLADWAAMLVMNDAYDCDGLDESEVEELNELALLTSPDKT
jgi:hypothetical protein